LRDNGRGIVVGSELIEQKATTARRNLSAAGLDDFADIRTGDARLTLNDPGGSIDIVLLDRGPALYIEVLQMLVPHLRPGALVIADNIDDNLHPYATWVRNPANGFVSSSITLKGGTEYSVWVDTTNGRVPES
jgi:predicted O-methyltransferase YrrM